ncbi:hypothetical protein PYCCODRAFT_1414786 [Trametes coccinea BRFM310]|uniref:Uncharacterized protein n=1 Tax=Trametes coccinea (strain BRFM310) TaxID=1353009 RepID=A0A1Y2IHN8_TRAC3|nr:hypothetical protein PYCCODRAFT_1414786 [Trametes coccinea BRFM310]
MLSSTGANRRQSVTNTAPPLFNLTLPEVYSDSREHGYRGPTRHVRLPRATTNGGGSIAKSEDGVRCVVAGRESLRILRMSEVGPSGSSTPTEHKSVTGRGGHRIEASRNLWEGSGLKVDSSSTDVAWCHGSFNTKILTSARNGELIMWDLNKNGPSKYERRTRDHARSIHVLQYSPILQCYCMTGSADGDLRIWDIRDMTKSIMRIHHPSAVRAVAFSPVSSQSRHVVAALDNGSIYRWDLNMGQRGQLDRIPVAHSGPVLSLDWVPPSTPSPSLLSATRQPSSSTWYGGAIDEILPSTPVAGASTNDNESSGPGWIISGGMDRTVKVWDLTQPSTRSHTAHRPAYTLHTSFPVRRVLWRPGYECELAVVSNADFGTGTDFGHTSLSGGPSSASIGLSSGLSTALSSPRLSSAHLSGTESPRTPEERSSSVSRRETSDPVEIWDVRRGYIAKWVVNGSAVEGGVTDIDFGDSHALWALHSSGTFSQLDLRQCRKPLDAIPRSAISWNTTGSIAFVTDRPKRWEIPYDDIDPEMNKDKPPVKGLGDRPFRPATQNVGAFAPDGAPEDLEMIEKLARGYIYEGKEKRLLCAYNAEIAANAGAYDAAQTWNLLESLLTDLNLPPIPPLSPLPLNNPPLPHSSSAPAAIPTVHTVNSPPAPPQRSMTVDASLYPKQKDNSPGSHSKYSDEKYTRRSNSGHRSPRKITPTSSTASSPRKASTGLPSVPAALFARRESATAAAQPPTRPRLPSSFRRPSFSTQSILSGHSESPSDNLRASLRHVGEGALDDSDSSESGSNEDATEGVDDPKGASDHEGDSTAPSASSRATSATYLHRTTTAHPSPLSRVAGKQTWTEDEKDDEDSPSPGSTSESEDGGTYYEDEDDESGGERRLASMPASTSTSRRPSLARTKRRSSTRSKTRSRSSTVASLAVSPAPRTPFSGSRRVARQESRSSIRTVTVESTPSGTLSRADGALRRDETVRDLSGGRAGSLKGSQTLSRPKSEAFSHDFALDQDQGGNGFGVRMSLGETGAQTPLSTTRTCSDQTKAVIREAEEKLRELAWETVRERFEQYADEGDVIMCAMLSLVVPEELKISRQRVTRFVEAYIDILNRLRLHTCAAYMRKFVPLDDVKATTSLQTAIYTSCGKCRKPFVLPTGPMVRAGRPSGSYAYCTSCKANVVKCSICHLPVRSLLYQCSICLHGGHQECYRAYYYSRKPPEEIAPPPLPPSLRVGRTPERELGRGRALSKTGSTVAGDTESEDGGSAQGDGDGTTGSYSSAKGVLVSSTKVLLGHPCAAGCGHMCWAASDKSDAVL